MTDGNADGLVVGFVVVGTIVGRAEGILDGAVVEGLQVGTVEGRIVGLNVVGETVGVQVGAIAYAALTTLEDLSHMKRLAEVSMNKASGEVRLAAVGDPPLPVYPLIPEPAKAIEVDDCKDKITT